MVGRVFCLCMVLFVLATPASVRAVGTADEVHYTFTGPTSVAFDWRGTATDLRYGSTASYGTSVTAHTPSPLPFSSSGPFQEVELTGLAPGATYHYSIGGAADHTFTTAPTGSFRFDVIADVGSSLQTSKVLTTQNQIAADSPAFVLISGDLTYAHPNGQAVVDQHFNDVMAWSQQAAYMPAWGNHEWEAPSEDDLRNYKGRFVLPHPLTAVNAPAAACCGDDSGWFDAGGVRFISYPEPYSSSTWSNWQSQIDSVFASAQASPSIRFIVTYGHRPAYSTGFHPGEPDLAGILNTFGDRYPKYVLNFNGHSHDYERYQPIHGVTHITAAGGGYQLEAPWVGTDSRTAFRAMHLEHVRVDVSSTGIRVQAVCGPPTSLDDVQCVQGSVIDEYTIGADPPPPPPPPPILYVDKGNPNCSNSGSGTQTQPFCSIGTAASRVLAGQTVLVSSGTYNEKVTVTSSGTAIAPISFVAAPGATVTITGAANGFYLSGRSYITVRDFNITRTTDDGIVVKNSSNVELWGNHVSYSGQPANGQAAKGIRIEGTTDSVISDNTVDHNTAYGIYLDLGATRNQVSENVIFSNAFGYQRAASGIRLHSSSGNTVSSNVSYANEDSGIEFDKSTNNLAVNNVTYNNGDHGIDVTASSSGVRVIANTVYKNVTAGINIEGTSTGVTVANNISVDNGIASPRTHSNIRVESGSTSGTTLDYNLLNLSTPDVMAIWNSVSYNSLAAFRSATGQETHGIQADPKWAGRATGNFHLLAGSPAIDSANSGASGAPTADVDGAEREDDPSTPNTGAGPRGYDDRGAYEFDAAELDHIVISPSTATAGAGNPTAFSVQGFDAFGNSFGDVTASSTFSISPSGSCTGNACTATIAGPYAVTAYNDAKTSTASLTVTAGTLDHLVLAPASADITAGDSKSYTAEGRDQFENSLGDVTATTAFTIAPNGSCAGSTCTATAVGAHAVTGTKAGKTGTAALQVSAGELDHIVISPTNATISAGGSRSYTAQAFDLYGNALGDVTANTTFTISPNGSCTGATCTATASGVHTVTGNDSGKTSSSTLTVTAGTLDHLALSPPSATIAAGDSRSYTAEGRDQYDNPLADMTASATFTIAPNGSCAAAACTATSAGPHTVTATVGGKSGTASLAVTAGVLDHLVLAPASASIAAGGSQTYTSEARDQYENSLGNATSSTTFTIAPEGSCTLATCSASTAGPHTVTGSLAGANGTASLDVTPGLLLDHITISPATATIAAGGTRAYAAEGFDDSGNSLGDVTANTTFTIEPDGSCTGNVCTATTAGPHTVTGDDGGKSSDASLTVTAGALDHLVLSPPSSAIAAGGSQTYTADGRDHYNNPLGDVTSATTFSVEPNGSCAAAACTATRAGAHTVIGTSAGKTGSASLTVTAGALDHLALTPATATIPSGGSQSFAAEARDQYDNPLGDATPDTTFTIAPDGSCTAAICTAEAAGPHTVTGTNGSATGTASLLVTAGTAVDHIVINPASASITAGDSQTYSVEAFDAAGNSLGDVTAGTNFSISPDGSCSNNVCTATAAGLHTVVAIAAGKTSSGSLAVAAGALDHLTLSPASATIGAGASQAYTAEGGDQYGNPLGDVTSSTTFTISPNGSCAAATCTANTTGGHTVTGTSAGKTGTASLQVTVGSLDHLVISPATATIAAGGSQAYTVEGFDSSNNSLGDMTPSTTFTVAPDGSCTGGVCAASVAGTHTVTASNQGRTSSASLTVTAATLDHLVLSPATSTIATGGSQSYTAEGRDQFNNSLGDMTAGTTFTIDPNGSCGSATCTASVSGAHTVTGTSAGKTGTASLEVTAGSVLDHIVITPTTASIGAGGSQAFSAQGFDGSGNSLGDVTSDTTFSILPNGSCSGNVCTATVAGAHTVTGNDGGKTSTASLTVTPGALHHLALAPASATIASGGSQAYTADARDQYDNSRGDVTASTTFSIAPNGSCSGATCTASLVGVHTVTGTNAGKTGTASLTVASGALDRIVVSPANATIVSGGSQAYTAEGFDVANNSLGDLTASTTFTIAPNGSCSGNVCTATAGGPHTVTGTNGGKTSTASLAINLVRNPGFETDTSGWNTSGSGANITLTRVAGGHSGGWAAQLTNTGSTTATYATLQDSPNWVGTTSAGTYTGTLWVRGDTAGAILKLKIQEYSGSTLLGSASSQITLSTSWQQVTVVYAIKGPGSTLDFQAYVSNPAPGAVFYADDASIILG